MDNIKPNSHKYKDANASGEDTGTRLKPILSEGKARIQKKSSISKLTGSIISEDAKNVKSYIFMDVLIPSFKKAISDIVTNGIDIILYGEAGHTKRTNNASRVSYRNYSDSPNDRFGKSGGTRYDSASNRERGDTRSGSVSLFDDIVVDSRGEAEDILSRMGEYLEVYPVISIADMYDLANITNFPHTCNNYGWKSIADAKIVRISDGYLIKMPPIESIK
jgi:hypothetical protein